MEGHDKDNEHPFVLPLTVSAVMLIVGLTATHLLDDAPCNGAVVAWYAVAFLLVGLRVMVEAVEHARQGNVFTEFTLMSIAAMGAFVIGEYPEAVAVMLLYRIGEALQDRAVARARNNIRAMMELRPDHAVVVSEGQRFTMQPEDVAVGSVIEVLPGDRVPIDGILLSAATAFDTAALTGETMPRAIENGSEVLAGMIATDTAVQLRTLRPYSESAVARILKMVEDSASHKATTELFIRRFARVYTPTVFLLAVMVVVAPLAWSLLSPSFHFSFTDWFYRALVLLVISCPCALMISIPLSYFAGIGAAAHRGILLKGGYTLDTLTTIDTVAFDKTGTLTTGELSVVRTEQLSVDDLSMVAAMERKSNHPAARAIVRYAGTTETTPPPGEIINIAGLGLRCDGWLVGTIQLLTNAGIVVPEHIDNAEGTIVAVATDGCYKGCILLSDTLKTDAHHAVEALHHIETHILSGDRQCLVDAVATTIGITHAHGDMLPADKAAYIEHLRSNGRHVVFVGDGINDAPVLAASDVGIAIGAGGTDMAAETADIVLSTGRPSCVAEAINIARRTRTVVRQNITFTIGFKLAVMLLGAAGIANIWLAVLADSGVALLAVLNAVRIFRHHS